MAIAPAAGIDSTVARNVPLWLFASAFCPLIGYLAGAPAARTLHPEDWHLRLLVRVLLMGLVPLLAGDYFAFLAVRRQRQHAAVLVPLLWAITAWPALLAVGPLLDLLGGPVQREGRARSTELIMRLHRYGTVERMGGSYRLELEDGTVLRYDSYIGTIDPGERLRLTILPHVGALLRVEHLGRAAANADRSPWPLPRPALPRSAAPFLLLLCALPGAGLLLLSRRADRTRLGILRCAAPEGPKDGRRWVRGLLCGPLQVELELRSQPRRDGGLDFDPSTASARFSPEEVDIGVADEAAYRESGRRTVRVRTGGAWFPQPLPEGLLQKHELEHAGFAIDSQQGTRFRKVLPKDAELEACGVLAEDVLAGRAGEPLLIVDVRVGTRRDWLRQAARQADRGYSYRMLGLLALTLGLAVAVLLGT